MRERKVIHGIIAAGAFCLFLTSCSDKPSFKTDYQAVFMDGGQVFFGKLEQSGAAYPLLRDVYYIGRQPSPDSKETKAILIKRGSEWHGPDYMYINKQHIAFIEPVAANSRVAQLIKEAKAQQPQQATQPSEGTGK
jgi:hypothetical protein